MITSARIYKYGYLSQCKYKHGVRKIWILSSRGEHNVLLARALQTLRPKSILIFDQ